jgi:hypothetical protein
MSTLDRNVWMLIPGAYCFEEPESSESVDIGRVFGRLERNRDMALCRKL